MTLIDYTVSAPTIDQSVFSGTQSNAYWTSVADAQSSSYIWVILFDNAEISDFGISNVFCTRCVRLGSSNSPNRYTDETGAPLTGASTQVRDTLTGLIWQRTTSSFYTWSAAAASGSAQAYCIDLPLGGQTWRLPAIKELFTLVDRSLPSGATIDPVAFPDTPANYFWSSTVVQQSSSIAWSIGFMDGFIASFFPFSYAASARCVR
jgi:hypothetical protein